MRRPGTAPIADCAGVSVSTSKPTQVGLLFLHSKIFSSLEKQGGNRMIF